MKRNSNDIHSQSRISWASSKVSLPRHYDWTGVAFDIVRNGAIRGIRISAFLKPIQVALVEESIYETRQKSAAANS